VESYKPEGSTEQKSFVARGSGEKGGG
jgi:hypothetical protein